MNNRLLSCIMRIGRLMVESGAEIYRVEESLERVLRAYGAKEVNVFAITSNIMVSVECDDYVIKNYSCRIRNVGTHVERVDRLNDLVRRLAAEAPEVEVVEAEVEKILAMKEYSNNEIAFANGLIACSFSVFFGARNVEEIVMALMLGMSVGVCSSQLEGLKANRLLNRFSCSFLVTFLTFLLAKMGLIMSVDEVIIGILMTLVPGCGFTNALRDLFTGDSISGALRLIEAILVAFAIAGGYVLAGVLMGGVLL